MTKEEQHDLNKAVGKLNQLLSELHERYGDAIHIRPQVNYSVGSFAEVHVEVTGGVVKLTGTTIEKA